MKNSTIIMILAGIILLMLIMKKPIQKALTRGYRNNNPGNIRLTFDKKGNKTYWQGEIDGSDKDFKTFKTMADGYRALFALLKEYSNKGYNTINLIISRYAPANENFTQSYIDSVAKRTGIDPDQELNYSNVSDFKNLVAAISYHENGISPDISDIDKGYNKLYA